MKHYLLVIVIIYTSSAYSIDTSSVKYFPLKAGNAWYYKTTFYPIPFPPIFHKAYIEKDTIISGKKYFKHNNGGSLSYIRIDSLNGNFLAYSPGSGCGSYTSDKIIDSLASSPGDLITCWYMSIMTRRCGSVYSQNVFGIMTEVKEFYYDGLITMEKVYAKNFGVVYYCSGEPPPCTGFSNLIGCKIDGIVYGDTNLSNVNQISNVIPDNFYLSQNYPNPFNPVTKLEFGIPESGFVSLKVYDVLGKEVAVLVNERKNPGSYSVEFDGTNLPGGIYFYTLRAGDFIETKRMIMLK